MVLVALNWNAMATVSWVVMVQLLVAAGVAADVAHLKSEDVIVQYRAAAVQYAPFGDWDEDGPEVVLNTNFQTILQLANNASDQDCDVIVFPEYGLTSTNLGADRADFKRMCQVVPNPQDARVPCLENLSQENYKWIEALSCLALELDIYLVVHLAELSLDKTLKVEHNYDGSQQSSSTEDELRDDDFVAYSTQVVFDRSGAVIARYRKKHLFLEPLFEYGNEDDSTALFTTDFGVTFTLQVCFDIMYESPGLRNVLSVGIRDVAMSTAWIDELPFLTAPQIFSSWSRGLRVNLIVSNLFNPGLGEMGSGIFHGVQEEEPNYTYDAESIEPVLIVSSITTVVDGDLMEDFKEYSDILVNRSIKHVMKFIRFSESKLDDENPLALDDISIQDVGKLMLHFLREIKLHVKDRKYVKRMLRTILKSERHLTEWKRYQNRMTCTIVCLEVRNNLKKHVAEADEVDNHTSVNPEHSVSEKHEPLSSVFHRDSFHFIIHENISLYAHKIIAPGKVEHVCYHDTFCCEVEYITHPLVSTATYMLLAYNGTVAKGSGVYNMWTEVCSVVYCTDRDIMTCTNIDSPVTGVETGFKLKRISGRFDTPYIYPAVFGLNFKLIEDSWNLVKYNTSTTLQANTSIGNILTASLFGRWYALDDETC